ncbi:MAG TPA: hypothetical protein VGG29_15880 [Caulobacteraceae bacterium]
MAEIGAIRSQLAKGEKFHGLGPTAFAATAVLAVFAAVAQALFLPAPSAHIPTFLMLWIGVAAVAAGVIGFEMVDRTRRLHSHLAQEMIMAAVGQFLPAAITAALLTAVLSLAAPQCLWMAPGLWQIAFGIGVFASCRFLPRLMTLVGGWYIATGLACIALAQGSHALSPWSMGLPFGAGQLLVAAVLRYSEAAGE